MSYTRRPRYTLGYSGAASSQSTGLATKTKTYVPNKWRDDPTRIEGIERVMGAANKVAETPIQMFIAGGAVRDLVYDVKYPDKAPPKDIDLFITGLSGTKKEKFEWFKKVRDVLFGQQFTSQFSSYPDKVHEIDDPENIKQERFIVLSIKTEQGVDIELIEGKDDIDSTVANFDWYECCWYLKDIKDDFAFRPTVDFIREQQDVDVIQPERDVLTLLRYRHPPKTLMRGFKLVQRHGFLMRTLDAQVLATEARLQEGKYGSFLHS